MNKDQQTPQREIEALLSRHIGLNINSLGAATLAQSMSQAMGAMGCTDAAAFLNCLNESEKALEALVEAVIVPETSFFRSPESFTYLRDYLVSVAQTQTHQRSWRVLSLPCSTGEEPYSIAITFLEAGVPSDKFQVDGVDISPTALTKAQQGVYQGYSFRRSAAHSPDQYIQQYFQLVQDRYHLDAAVKSQVQFHHGNLASADCLRDHGSYDIVFCRNLLIYLHQAARDRALQNLYRLLVPNGLLFVGYAETHQIDRQRFAPIRAPKAFVYRRLPQESARRGISHIVTTTDQVQATQALFQSLPKLPHQLPDKKQSSSPSLLKNSTLLRSSLTPAQEFKKNCTAKSAAIPNNNILSTNSPSTNSLTSHQQVAAQAATENTKKITVSSSSAVNEWTNKAINELTSEPDLTAIWALADRGQFEIAMEQCHCYLKTHPTHAAAYLLLGELYQAQGDDNRAEIAFQKTLYLDPNCIEALIHWALLCEQRGDQATGQRLRQRLKRVMSNTLL